ncbi:hypothetical protein FVEN_g831 [Fusarium venenatum]|nr:hypothetical protein FVEN_g831 [Fusarium venenatum]KAH6967340.1 hypothetical protein EDB82DRAFT_518356 [Fusarium venenatum]
MVGIVAPQNSPSPEVRDSPTQSPKSPSPDWTRKQLRIVQDVIRPTERLLNCVKSNASMILRKLHLEYDECMDLLLLSNNVLDIATKLHASQWALVVTAKANIAQIRTLIDDSNEASNQASSSHHAGQRSSDQALNIPRDIIGQQVKILERALQNARDADEKANKSYEGKAKAEERVEEIITQIKACTKKIKKWEERKSRAEAELRHLSLLVTFSKIGEQGVRILEEKYPGLLKDLGDMAREFEGNNE